MRLLIKHIMHVDVETRLLSNKESGKKTVSKNFLSSDNTRDVLLESRENAFHCPPILCDNTGTYKLFVYKNLTQQHSLY
jgi:hypothetical protein